MSLVKESEKYLLELINGLGFELDNIKLVESNHPEFGEYQINVAMMLAKKYGKNPREIAQQIVDALDDRFVNVNIQGPGFINVSFSEKVLVDYLNGGIKDFQIFIDRDAEPKTIVLDYGGANIAKTLHVGHLRCNIGESVRRLLNVYGDKTISDVHWGDWGTPIGLAIREIQELQPNLPYFDPNYKGEYPKNPPVTNEELGVIYPTASKKKKENPIYEEEAKKLTVDFQNGVPGIKALWKHIVDLSKAECQEIYDYLNCNFTVSYGESDADAYVKPTLEFLKSKGVTELSDGALIMHVKTNEDNKEIPPLMLVKSDGAVLYDTTELATMYQRVQDFNPDGMWYFTDERQALHFEQSFRGAIKSGLAKPDMDFRHIGFGTINGPDGKPFKTRDGGVMPLKELINLVYSKIEPKIKPEITGEDRVDIANKLTVATLKYSDLLPYRKTDYIFDVDKFTAFEGKTGIYCVYTTTRIKSLLNKVGENNKVLTSIPNQDVRDILIKLTTLPASLKQAYNDASPSYVCDALYEICALYNKFYTNYNISNEENEEVKNNYIALSELVYNVLSNLLNILGIDEVDKM